MTRASVLRLCHRLDREAGGTLADEAVVWAVFTDRRALMLGMPRFAKRDPGGVVVLVAPDAPFGPIGAARTVSTATGDPLVQEWQFGTAAAGHAVFLRAFADGPPPTSKDSRDRMLSVQVVHGEQAAAGLQAGLAAVGDRLAPQDVERAQAIVGRVGS